MEQGHNTLYFQPSHLEVINESNMHNVPKGSETHFKVVVVSDSFEGLSLVKRHRAVNEVLAQELQSGVHALSIQVDVCTMVTMCYHGYNSVRLL